MKRLAMLIGLSIAAAACGPIDTLPKLPAGDVQAGAVVYQQNCASCHGAELQGTNSGPSHLSIFYEPNHHPDQAFRSAIANGAAQHHWAFGSMPPVPGMTESEIEAVIAFVRSEQVRQGFDN